MGFDIDEFGDTSYDYGGESDKPSWMDELGDFSKSLVSDIGNLGKTGLNLTFAKYLTDKFGTNPKSISPIVPVSGSNDDLYAQILGGVIQGNNNPSLALPAVLHADNPPSTGGVSINNFILPITILILAIGGFYLLKGKK